MWRQEREQDCISDKARAEWRSDFSGIISSLLGMEPAAESSWPLPDDTWELVFSRILLEVRHLFNVIPCNNGVLKNYSYTLLYMIFFTSNNKEIEYYILRVCPPNIVFHYGRLHFPSHALEGTWVLNRDSNLTNRKVSPEWPPKSSFFLPIFFFLHYHFFFSFTRSTKV